jgi:hypothetical protein
MHFYHIYRFCGQRPIFKEKLNLSCFTRLLAMFGDFHLSSAFLSDPLPYAEGKAWLKPHSIYHY